MKTLINGSEMNHTDEADFVLTKANCLDVKLQNYAAHVKYFSHRPAVD